MSDKLKFAFYWMGACGGCEVAVLDINEKILDVIGIADIVFWPVAIDVKYKDVENMPDKFIDVAFINGAIRNSENEHIAKLLREKSKTVVAFGSCACFGSIPALANLSTKEQIFETVYKKTPSTKNDSSILPQETVQNLGGMPPGEQLTLPEFLKKVRTLDSAVKVDYYLPGCPPPVKLIGAAVEAIATGKLPPAGSTIAGEKSVCDECKKERQDKDIKDINRPHTFKPDYKKCLLEQGLICMGPATRSGCDAACLSANMPCTGCLGPCAGVTDQGAKMISALGSVLRLSGEETVTENEIDKLTDKIADPVGTFYKYTLANSLLGKIRDKR